jgi:DNA polymerase-3 subunit gamma/tau
MKDGGRLALYRKYRPKSLDDLVGQPQVTDILRAALKKDMIGHAYLFSGPRGTGKTSAARILAHQFNDIDYSENLNLDIIEIDAASNRRIEDIRDLREVIKLAPTKLKFKVYIIDEVHMLTNESFNALLKTLEEPPAHAIFILATTDLHKVPATILSRTQKFNFRLLSAEQMSEHLAKIAKMEDIKINPEALSLIAELSGGSVRDAISILDQLHALGDEINEEFVRDVMGMPSAALEADTIKALDDFDSSTLLSLVTQMLESGSDAREIIKNFISLTAEIKNPTNLHLNLIDHLSSALNSYSPDMFLKIALIKFNPNIRQVELKPSESVETKTDTKLKAEPQAEKKPEDNLKADSKPPKESKEKEPESDTKLNSSSVEEKAQPETESESLDSSTAADKKLSEKSDFKFSSISWIKVLEEVKSKSAPTFAALRLAKPEFKDGKLNLTFKFDFHKKKLDESKNKKILLDALKLVFGSEPDLKYNIDKGVDLGNSKLGDVSGNSDNQNSENENQESILSKVNDIMGGGEVVEA